MSSTDITRRPMMFSPGAFDLPLWAPLGDILLIDTKLMGEFYVYFNGYFWVEMSENDPQTG